MPVQLEPFTNCSSTTCSRALYQDSCQMAAAGKKPWRGEETGRGGPGHAWRLPGSTHGSSLPALLARACRSLPCLQPLHAAPPAPKRRPLQGVLHDRLTLSPMLQQRRCYHGVPVAMPFACKLFSFPCQKNVDNSFCPLYLVAEEPERSGVRCNSCQVQSGGSAQCCFPRLMLAGLNYTGGSPLSLCESMCVVCMILCFCRSACSLMTKHPDKLQSQILLLVVLYLHVRSQAPVLLSRVASACCPSCNTGSSRGFTAVTHRISQWHHVHWQA